jgi:hypothetical protein
VSSTRTPTGPSTAQQLWALRAVVAVAVGFFLWRFVGGALALLGEPDALNYGEGVTYAAALRLATGEPLYGSPDAPPFAYLGYPPGHPFVASLFIRVFGEGLAGVRALTVLAELAVASIVGAWVWSVRRHAVATALAVATTLGVLSGDKFHALARIDFLVVALTLAGLWTLDRVRRAEARAPMTAPFFLAAALIKPTALVVLAGPLLLALLERRRAPARAGRTAAAATWALGAGIVGLAGADLVFGGAISRQVFAAQSASGFDLVYFQRNVRVVLAHYDALFALWLVALIVVRREAMLLASLLASLAWWLFSSAKVGADVNYALEPIALMLVALGAALADLPERLRSRLGAIAPVLPAASFVVAVSLMLLGHGHYWEVSLREAPRADRAELHALLAETEGLVIVDEPWLALAHGLDHWMTDPFHLVLLAEAGRWNERAVLRALERGEVARVVVGRRLAAWPALRPVLERHFDLVWSSRGDIVESRLFLWDLKASSARP